MAEFISRPSGTFTVKNAKLVEKFVSLIKKSLLLSTRELHGMKKKEKKEKVQSVSSVKITSIVKHSVSALSAPLMKVEREAKHRRERRVIAPKTIAAKKAREQSNVNRVKRRGGRPRTRRMENGSDANRR